MCTLLIPRNGNFTESFQTAATPTNKKYQAATPRLNFKTTVQNQRKSSLTLSFLFTPKRQHHRNGTNGSNTDQKTRQQHLVYMSTHNSQGSSLFFIRAKAASPRHNYPQLRLGFHKQTISTSVKASEGTEHRVGHLSHWVVNVTLAFGCGSNTPTGRTPQHLTQAATPEDKLRLFCHLNNVTSFNYKH